MTIRPFAPADREALYEICVRTADAGADARGILSDDRLWGDIFAVPYAVRHPEYAWVVEAPDGRAVGYLVGTPDTADFEAWFRDEWWARRAPHGSGEDEGTDAVSPRERSLLAYAAGRGVDTAPNGYPAHLHIDLLPEAQGQGLGRVLIDTMLRTLAEDGIPGLHLGVDPRNTAAQTFYTRLGFTPLPSRPGEVLLGIRP